MVARVLLQEHLTPRVHGEVVEVPGAGGGQRVVGRPAISMSAVPPAVTSAGSVNRQVPQAGDVGEPGGRRDVQAARRHGVPGRVLGSGQLRQAECVAGRLELALGHPGGTGNRHQREHRAAFGHGRLVGLVRHTLDAARRTTGRRPVLPARRRCPWSACAPRTRRPGRCRRRRCRRRPWRSRCRAWSPGSPSWHDRARSTGTPCRRPGRRRRGRRPCRVRSPHRRGAGGRSSRRRSPRRGTRPPAAGRPSTARSSRT